ncbi:24-hydroxycholesterol 7-alpha-hydroxylase isoform X2 [Protopterus annectens]|uniref:24-hydroxycholesterol 7-alpha-hydroxylase isoform X2 n=1 Tax=Protopterus annectens TaxID=7888 RepID=UPI001CFB722B|nr:24-hydroxycholesterol 7-alpha-hydroxylase isoform X2 [Protopterus annectens]
MDLFSAFLAFLLTALLYKYIFRRRDPTSPPCIKGWIPWLGAAFEFGKSPLEFIKLAVAKYGPIFTVLAAGNRLTFVTDAEDLDLFFNSKDVDFQQAVQEPVQHVASISRESFYKSHTAIHDTIKGRLAPSNLHLFSDNLFQEFSEHIQCLGKSGTEDLYDLVRQVMYPSVVNNLFGKGTCPTSKSEFKEFEKHFQKFDEDFEYGSQLPEIFLRDWSRSKHWLLSLFKGIVKNAEKGKSTDNDSKTLLQHLLDTLNGNATANYSLLLLWASQANAIPITFWTLAFIISHPSVYKAIMEEISSVLDEKDNILTVTQLQKLPQTKWCILEAIRLRAPGAITRKVVHPLKIKNYIVPPGDLLMMSPFWAHRSTKYFPDPEKFLPERWQKADLEKNVFLDGFVAFGGGRYQCPGRWFALLEIHMFVALILSKYSFSLLDPVPKQLPLSMGS